jgi:uncharacterized Zn finger protein (UPF0148 family)
MKPTFVMNTQKRWSVTIYFHLTPSQPKVGLSDNLYRVILPSSHLVNELRCPYCGSRNLVWDYSRGEVICADCGSVIDRIYVADNAMTATLEEVKDTRRYRGTPHISRATKEYLRLLKRIKGSRRLSKRAVIDPKNFMEYIDGRRGRVKTVKVGITDTHLLTDTHVSKVLKIINKYPRLNSRTDRAKIALALIAIGMATKSRLEIRSLSRATSLSEMHIRRLRKTLSTQKGFINEVRRALRDDVFAY